MHVLRTLVIDSDPQLRQYYRRVAAEYLPDVYLMDEYANFEEAVRGIKNHKPDLVILDTELGYKKGFDLLDYFPEPDFMSIFISHDSSCGMEALKFGAVDFLLKPALPADINKAVQKAKRLHTLKQQQEQTDKLEKSVLFIKTNEGFLVHNTENITRLESDGNYTLIHIQDEEPIMTSRTLKTYLPALENKPFLRVHRSHLVNLKYIKKYVKSEASLYMQDGSKIEVAKSRLPELLSLSRHEPA